MILLPKNWTGLEEKPDGTYVYSEVGTFMLRKTNGKKYVVNEKTRGVVKKIAGSQIIAMLVFLPLISSENIFKSGLLVLGVYFLFGAVCSNFQNRYVANNSNELNKD
jgi:hypothetical protein